MSRSRPRWAHSSLKQDHQAREGIASNRQRGRESKEADSTILISSVPAAKVRSRTAKVADTASSNAPRVSDPRTSEEAKSDENRSPVPNWRIGSFGVLSRHTEEPSIATVSMRSSGVSASCAPVTTTLDGSLAERARALFITSSIVVAFAPHSHSSSKWFGVIMSAIGHRESRNIGGISACTNRPGSLSPRTGSQQ